MADPELEEGEVLATDGDQKVCSRAGISDCDEMRSEGSHAHFLTTTLDDRVGTGAWPAVRGVSGEGAAVLLPALRRQDVLARLLQSTQEAGTQPGDTIYLYRIGGSDCSGWCLVQSKCLTILFDLLV